MKIGILVYSRPKEAELPNTNVRRLIEAGRTLGHEVIVIHEPLIGFHQNGALRATYGAEPFPNLDRLINRPNFTEEPTLHTITLELLNKLGLTIINGNLSVFLIKNKLHQHAVFAEADVPCPRWSLIYGPDGLDQATKNIGWPIVAKVAFGTHGKGVFFAKEMKTLRPIVDYLGVRDGNPIILEEFIEESKGTDIRAFVVGGKVVAAMERRAKEDEVRANIGAGGIGYSADLNESERRVVLHAARVFHLEIAGVDLLRSKRGPLVLEVNANPGFEELERVTGVDVAGAVIKYASSLHREAGAVLS